jgi:hypothetical protein
MGINMDISQVLTNKYPGAVWSLDGADYSGLNWVGPLPKPSESKIRAYWEEVQEAMASESMAREDARVSAYKKLNGWGLTPDEIAAIVTP